MRREQGQGTVEYVGIVLLLAAVLVATIAAVVPDGIGERVTHAMRKAICIVTGAVCDEARRAASAPCVRSSVERSEGGTLTVAVIRTGDRNAVIREERADGTIALTLIDEDSVGVEVGVGAELHVRWGSLGYAVGRELRAAVLAERGSGRTWILPGGDEAEAAIRRLRVANHPFAQRSGITAPDPDVTYAERGSALELSFQAGGRHAARLSAGTAYGERVDHAAGRRTVYIRGSRQARGKVSFGRDGSATGEGVATERFGVTYDRDGRPIDLVVLSTLDVAGGVNLPPALARIAGWLEIPRDGDRHLEIEQHLDLTDPAGGEAAQAFLERLGDDRVGIELAAEALRERLDAAGTVSVRAYAGRDSAREAGGSAKLGPVAAGMEVGSRESTARLVGAVARGSDGRWGSDGACPVA